MLDRLSRAPQAMLLLGSGLAFGMVWAAGSTPGTPAAAQRGGGGLTSVSAGPGLTASPNPITSTGTISAAFGGNGAATTVSRSDHDHDARYVQQAGGTMSGDLAFTGNRQIIAPRVENAAAAPAGAAAGRLWFDTTETRLKVHDGVNWISVPQIFTDQNLALRTIGAPDVLEDLDCSVTFTLPAEETVLLDGGAWGEARNLISYGVVPPGIQTSNHLRLDVEVLIDSTLVRTLASWEGTFTSANVATFGTKAGAASLVRLPAGTHTARLAARRHGELNPGGATLPSDAYSCSVQELWLRVHRP